MGDGRPSPLRSPYPRTRWLPLAEPNPRARLRLFCLPYAGGAASVFRAWADDLPASVDVCPIQLPGREQRFADRPLVRVAPLVADMEQALSPYLDLPYAIFGHSMGAIIAFELARALARRANVPRQLIVSGHAAPHLEPPRRLRADLPDRELIDGLRQLTGTPEFLLENHQLMQIMLPTIRADLAICDAYSYVTGDPLACPITVYGGLYDPCAPSDMLPDWQLHTSAGFRIRLFPGEHFFLHTARSSVLSALAQDLLS